jgi:Zn-dependent protease
VLLQDPPEVILAVILVGIFLLVAYPVHEFAHAWAAYMQGDSTAKLFGRLTLNPIVHFDPLGGTLTALSLLFSPILFGWAKPTPVNPSNFRDRRNGDVIVSMAGPFSNLVMAVLGAFVARLGTQLNAWDSLPYQVAQGVYFFVAFNVLLAIFNLIPVPPLDGSALLYRFLTPAQAWKVRPILSQYGFILVLGVFLLAGGYISRFIFDVTDFLVGG